MLTSSCSSESFLDELRQEEKRATVRGKKGQQAVDVFVQSKLHVKLSKRSDNARMNSSGRPRLESQKAKASMPAPHHNNSSKRS